MNIPTVWKIKDRLMSSIFIKYRHSLAKAAIRG